MSLYHLAMVIVISALAGLLVALHLSRQIMKRPATTGSGVALVALWTVLVAGVPYLIFTSGASRRQGILEGFALLVIGLLPLLLVLAPIVGLIFAIYHYNQHIQMQLLKTEDTNYSSDVEPAHRLHNRDTRNPLTTPDNPENHCKE